MTKTKIAYLLSHPIQYQSVVLRRISAQDDIDIQVFYGLDTVSQGAYDPQFGQHVQWDVPLLDGHAHEFLPNWISAQQPGALLPLHRGLRQRLKEGQFDMLWLHGWGRLAELRALADAKALGLPVLMRTENNFRGTARPRPGLRQGLKERLKHRVLRQCDAFGYMGQAGYDYFRAYRVDHAKLFDMPYVVDNAWWQTACEQSNKALSDPDLGLDPQRPTVLYVGKLIERKGVIPLIQACQSLPPAQQPNLVIVGSGPLMETAKAAAKGLLHCHFAGFQNQAELPQWFALADLFAIPSRDEQWGVVVNEAMNGACAVLASDEVGSAPELVIPGVTGDIYPAGDQAKLEASLKQLLSQPDKLRTMGKTARQHINDFGPERVLAGLRDAIAYLRSSGKIGPAGKR